MVKGVKVVQAYASFSTLGLGGFNAGDMGAALFFFLLLLYLLKKFAWGPLLNIMEEREEFVANEITEAEKSRKEAAIAAEEAQAQLLQTKQEAQKIIEDAKNTGIEQEKAIIEQAQLESERIKKEAQKDIQNEKEKALQALQDKVASLSVLIASKVIEKELSSADQEAMIDQYIKEIGEER